jgi:hypothetical protein
MSQQPEELEKPFVLKLDRAMIYGDMLRFILLKLLPDDVSWRLDELRKLSKQWCDAIEAGDEKTADSLRRQQEKLTSEIIDAAKD